jgi:hypothetical protein
MHFCQQLFCREFFIENHIDKFSFFKTGKGFFYSLSEFCHSGWSEEDIFKLFSHVFILSVLLYAKTQPEGYEILSGFMLNGFGGFSARACRFL